MNKPQPVQVGYDGSSSRDRIGLWSPPEQPRLISPLTAIRIAAALYSVEENDLLSHRRWERFVDARALVVWTLRVIPSEPMSYPKIGRVLGGRDHTTIIDLHRRAIRLRLADETFDRCCDAILMYFKKEGYDGRIPTLG